MKCDPNFIKKINDEEIHQNVGLFLDFSVKVFVFSRFYIMSMDYLII